jgi:hypothetical protein
LLWSNGRLKAKAGIVIHLWIFDEDNGSMQFFPWIFDYAILMKAAEVIEWESLRKFEGCIGVQIRFGIEFLNFTCMSGSLPIAHYNFISLQTSKYSKKNPQTLTQQGTPTPTPIQSSNSSFLQQNL